MRERGPPTESDGAVFRLIWRMEKEEEEGGVWRNTDMKYNKTIFVL